ncbi:hypothetical protein B0H14DRAFT_3437442 [Mycena olivaceomarginata]|nr:hypothetical protein B0H14DRAFT_3437442 [Mycena olivaceomarginata]
MTSSYSHQQIHCAFSSPLLPRVDAGLPRRPLATHDHSPLIIAPPPHAGVRRTLRHFPHAQHARCRHRRVLASYGHFHRTHSILCCRPPQCDAQQYPRRRHTPWSFTPPPRTPRPSAAAYPPENHDARAMPARMPDTMRTTAGVPALLLLPIADASAVAVASLRTATNFSEILPSPLALAPTAFLSTTTSTFHMRRAISHDSFVPSPPTASIISVVAMPAHLTCRQCDVQHQRRAQRSGRSTRSPRTHGIPSLPARLPTPARQILTLRRLGRTPVRRVPLPAMRNVPRGGFPSWRSAGSARKTRR